MEKKLVELIAKYNFDAIYDEEKRNQAREEAGKKAFDTLKEELLKAGYPEKEIASFACMLVRVAADADENAGEDEYGLFVKATGLDLDYNSFIRLAWNGSEEDNVEAVDQIVDSLSESAKTAAIEFVIVFLSADSKITDKEVKLLLDLID